MSRKLIVGNWKMNPQSVKDAAAIFKGISAVAKDAKTVDVAVCPPFPFLSINKTVTAKKVKIGAQDVSGESDGAFTGEISAKMVASTGAAYAIVGHSERRALGDTNIIVNKKMLQALKAKLSPIVCVGESERDSHGFYLGSVKKLLQECFKDISKAQMKNIVIAHEPVWAIGAGATRVATPEEFTEMKIFIRKTLSDLYDAKIAHAMQIIYGGSVHPENALAFVESGTDGFLVGRDSLNPKKFGAIIAACK